MRLVLDAQIASHNNHHESKHTSRVASQVVGQKYNWDNLMQPKERKIILFCTQTKLASFSTKKKTCVKSNTSVKSTILKQAFIAKEQGKIYFLIISQLNDYLHRFSSIDQS